MASAGNRRIAGLICTSDGIRPTRRVRRKLRAAQHNARNGRANNLESLKAAASLPLTPKQREERDVERASRNQKRDIETYWRRYGMTIGHKEWGKLIPERRLSGDYQIVNSQSDFIGMGLVHYPGQEKLSCLNPEGGHHKGVLGWASHPGVALAVKRKSVYFRRGLRMHSLSARALLFLLKDGKIAFGRIYADSTAEADALRQVLLAEGFLDGDSCFIESHVRGFIVQGTDYEHLPYLDVGRWGRCKLRSGNIGFKLVLS
jgi:hypothetical protein